MFIVMIVTNYMGFFPFLIDSIVGCDCNKFNKIGISKTLTPFNVFVNY